MQIGLFSTLRGPGSQHLVISVIDACRRHEIPDTEVAFVFCDGDPGGPFASQSLDMVQHGFGLPVVLAPAREFEPRWRRDALAALRAGDEEPIWAWREAYYSSLRDRLGPTDVDVLLGQMFLWSRGMCRERLGINLHPAAPGGPTGEWHRVIWDLVRGNATESGVMIHRVTPELDRGPVVTYCRYSIRGSNFDALWQMLPLDESARQDLFEAELARGRDTQHPLHRAIRQAGHARELPLILETLRSLALGRLRFEADGVVDEVGRPLGGGLDLTHEVEAALTPQSV